MGRSEWAGGRGRGGEKRSRRGSSPVACLLCYLFAGRREYGERYEAKQHRLTGLRKSTDCASLPRAAHRSFFRCTFAADRLTPAVYQHTLRSHPVLLSPPPGLPSQPRTRLIANHDSETTKACCRSRRGCRAVRRCRGGRWASRKRGDERCRRERGRGSWREEGKGSRSSEVEKRAVPRSKRRNVEIVLRGRQAVQCRSGRPIFSTFFSLSSSPLPLLTSPAHGRRQRLGRLRFERLRKSEVRRDPPSPAKDENQQDSARRRQHDVPERDLPAISMLLPLANVATKAPARSPVHPT